MVGERNVPLTRETSNEGDFEMKRLCIVALAALTLSSVAVAGEATRLTDEEMDNISAAGIGLGLSFAPGQTISAQAKAGGLGVSYAPGKTISAQAQAGGLGLSHAPGQTISTQAKGGGLSLSSTVSTQGLGRGLGRSFAPGLN